jgi:hypothetical protein
VPIGAKCPRLARVVQRVVQRAIGGLRHFTHNQPANVWEGCAGSYLFALGDLPASKTAPHLGQRILSESTRTISAGEIETPHEGQIVFSAARTFARLSLVRCKEWPQYWRA